MSKTFAKIGAIAVGATFALSLSVNTAGAVTVAELQAQINALMAQLASLQGGAAVSAQFTTDLTVGSTGSQVVALQQTLVAQGHLVMPAGVAYGYFGSLTKAAVMKWQAANGVSATGYFGPISRAKANAMGGTGVVPGTPVTGGATAGGTISTPGVEGTLTARLNSTPTAVKLYEGASKVAVLGVELEADISDIKVERIKLKLDDTDGDTNDRDFYRKVASRLYVMDGSTVLASADLNANTVIEESTGNFYITVTGLNHIVRKDTKKVLTVALDAMSNWDSTYNAEAWTVTVPVDGVRGVDGAGINQYSPTVAFSRDFTSEDELIGSATLQISQNSGTPKAGLVIAAEAADENEKAGVELLKFDVKAEKDAVTVTELQANIVHSATGGATTTTIYLMDGSTILDSITASALAAGTVEITFDDDFTVAAGSTRTLRIVADFVDANGTAKTYSASVAASQVTAENSAGTAITESGSATGETLTVMNAGPEITLSSKSISKTEIQFSGATSSAKATFNITLKAVGSDIYFGTQSASSTFAFQTYKGGTATTLLVASSTSWSAPSGVVTTGLSTGHSFKLQEGNTVTIPVDFLFEGRTTAGALVATDAYAVGLENVKWSPTGATTVTSDFMSGKTDWRTTSVTMP